MSAWVDAHHHYWRPGRGDYHWMPKDADHPLNRPFTPDDLAPALAACGIGATVLVQAAETEAETEYMLGIAEALPSVAAVVGWVDLAHPAASARLERLRSFPKFRGVRPMVQDYEDDGWLARPEVLRGIDAIVDLDLTFDALGYARQLPLFARLFERKPGLSAVIDHGMKPDVAHDGFGAWANGIAAVADATPVCVKLSGLATEDAPGASPERLTPYMTHLLDTFGPQRVMWGSDWPPLVTRMDYEAWFRFAFHAVPEAERAAVFGGTARAFYRLDP